MVDRRGRARTRAAASLLAMLFVLVLAACSGSPASTPTVAPTIAPTPSPTAVPTESRVPPTSPPTAAATGVSGVPACTADDLKASHGLVEGAAGSRLTTVALVAQVACSIDAFPAFALRDANGGALVGGTAGGSGTITLDPNASYESDVRLANWCAPDPAFPLELRLTVPAGNGVDGVAELVVSGSSFPEDGDMPPCNGAGGPVLEAGAWAVSG